MFRVRIRVGRCGKHDGGPDRLRLVSVVHVPVIVMGLPIAARTPGFIGHPFHYIHDFGTISSRRSSIGEFYGDRRLIGVAVGCWRNRGRARLQTDGSPSCHRGRHPNDRRHSALRMCDKKKGDDEDDDITVIDFEAKPDPSDEPLPWHRPFTPEELERQSIALDQLTAEWKAERLAREAVERRRFGFVPFAERLNARVAMIFFLIGILTEYWTGQTMPQQIDTFMRILGII